MSDRGPATTDAALRAAVRPFRLAAFALAGSLVRFEPLVAGSDRLQAALEPDLGTLTMSPFETLRSEPGPGGAVAEGRPVAGGRRRGDDAPAARRSAARRDATHTRPATRTVGAAPAAAEPGTGAAADPARAGAAAATSDAIAAGASLLGTLGDAAMDVLVPPPGTARSEEERKPSARPSPPAAAAGIDRLLGDVATGSVAESVPPGTGGAAVADPAAVETGPTLLDELADAALAASAGPKDPAAGRPTPPGAPVETVPRRRPSTAPRDTSAGGGSTVADLVLRSLGGTGVPPTRPPAPAPETPLLDQLAAAAITALAPAGDAATAQDEQPAPRPRSERETAVSRALDRVQAETTAKVGATEPVRAATPKNDSASLVQPPAATAPSDLAWLVNEALVEQARRHGVDLS